MQQNKLSRGPDGAGHRHLLGKAAAGLTAGAILASVMSVPAAAVLSETGPIDPTHGYPAWFSDGGNAAAGLDPLQLELCLDGPLCLATAERPNPDQPVSFPDNFPGEAFWWTGEASIDSGNTSALLVLAQEAAFVNEDPVEGDQVAFSRVRIRIDGVAANSNYTVTHPYGTITLPSDAAGSINFTEDHGCFDTPCNQQTFERAANGTVGPFLRWTSGAPEGYIGDPNQVHAVVGSPTGNNFFQVEGPGISPLRTDLFAIQGKLAGVFSDVATTHQFADAIAYAKNEGITTGYPDGTFRPLGSTERGAMAAFLYRYTGQSDATFTPPTTATFTDVPTNHQFFKEIEWLKNSGITTGMTPTVFAPNEHVSRKDMAAFLYRLSEEPEFTAPAASPFNDLTPDSQFYKEITWLQDQQITSGFDDGGYHPFENVQRQATAAFLYRMAGSPAV
ncbi:S-layer homology domain-containing protein [Pseudarthrobacter sp. NPDC058329]|uniref:S-layer homology domain-containing protein n=1 Tax=Pseudarthrobacter sp. NPDC058329 TaxID=3346448 RepID=UPI0036D9C45C